MATHYFDRASETMPRSDLRDLQQARLRSLLARLSERVPFYRRALAETGADPARVTLDDLAGLPFTRKDDLRDHYPFGLLAVGREEVARVHASSGTTGKLTVVAYTSADLDVLAQVNARCLMMAGARPGMMLHNAYGYGLFTGGLGLHAGAERLGMAVVPVSGGMTERQLSLIQDFAPDAIACTPSYGLTLAQAFADRGVAPDELSVSLAIVGAEPWTESMRSRLDAGLGARACNIYGLSEVIGPGVSGECLEQRSGSHVNEDHFLPEVIDPASGESVPDGEDGVLVITTLTKEALPLLRYWTGDVASLTHEPCRCGRTLVRMSPVRGRTDDMIVVRGVNLFPSQVEAALGELAELAPHYRLIVQRHGTLDEVEVEVEVAPDALQSIAPEGEEHGDARRLHHAGLEQRAARAIRASVACTVRIRLLRPGSLPRSEGGKLRRVVDRRQLG